MNIPLDEIDLTLLKVLQGNGRLSVSELSTMTNCSSSTVHRRLKRLVDGGVIRGFTAIVDRDAFGLNAEALIHIRLSPGSRSKLNEFHDYLMQLAETERVYYISGNFDFVVHVSVTNSEALGDLVSTKISSHPEVASTVTSLIFASSFRAQGNVSE